MQDPNTPKRPVHLYPKKNIDGFVTKMKQGFHSLFYKELPEFTNDDGWFVLNESQEHNDNITVMGMQSGSSVLTRTIIEFPDRGRPKVLNSVVPNARIVEENGVTIIKSYHDDNEDNSILLIAILLMVVVSLF